MLTSHCNIQTINSLLSTIQHHSLSWHVSYYGRRRFTYTISLYRKPTHTDQYLAYDSHHPHSMKRGIVQCQQPIKNSRKISNPLRFCPKLKVCQCLFRRCLQQQGVHTVFKLHRTLTVTLSATLRCHWVSGFRTRQWNRKRLSLRPGFCRLIDESHCYKRGHWG